MKIIVVTFFFLLSTNLNAQEHNYTKTLDWVIETFGQNDAGFQYTIDKKGENNYNRFTQDIKYRVASVNNDNEFIDLVYEWLHFFRKSHIQFTLKDSPVNQTSEFERDFKDNKLYLDQLSDKTLYFRIPSFEYNNKTSIDSVININRELIISTPNLIIDIRDGTGGNDASFRGLLPFIYTNPIRQDGILLKGSELNAQGFESYAELTNNQSLNDLAKSLRENVGKFVPARENEKASFIEFDSVLPYPQHIAIIINSRNVSADEQFLIYAKQSWKVKLFGSTTAGGIDISNLTHTFSPDDKFVLVWGMSKSKRIPYFTIDDIGIQPDFLIDNEIPENEWVNYTQSILEQ